VLSLADAQLVVSASELAVCLDDGIPAIAQQ
jgi:hypothetical protein